MATSLIDALTERLERLESIESIRQLKARYLNACDQQDPAAVRACFADGKVKIDTDYRGIFYEADAFVEMYRDAACNDYTFDKHQGSNAEIDILSPLNATGLWCLDYRNVNLQDKTLTLMSTFYHDEYEKIQGRWLISSSRCEFRTIFHACFAEGTLSPLIAGRSLAGPPLASGRKQGDPASR